jgi:hypothetical protein
LARHLFDLPPAGHSAVITIFTLMMLVSETH